MKSQQQNSSETGIFSNRVAKYFKINQSNAEHISFKYELNPKDEEPVHSESKGSKGMFYMLIAAICFTVSAFLLKLLYLKSNINTYEFTYWNSIVMGILNLFLFKYNNKDHLLVRDDMRTTLILRSICAFIGATGFYLAL
jgi:hypothetical protein